VQGEKKNWGRRKFWFPVVRIVAESMVVGWLNSLIRIIHQSKVHERREK
jgi:hypothetical protein